MESKCLSAEKLTTPTTTTDKNATYTPPNRIIFFIN